MPVQNMANNTTTIEVTEETTAITAEELTAYEKNIGMFWAFATFSVLIAIVAVVGNGLVIYIAHGVKHVGPLRYLDGVVKSLALTDLAFGLIATPLIIINYYMGEV